MSVSTRNLPLAVSIGEPAGIGPDLILKIWHDHRGKGDNALPPFFLLCDPDHLRARAALLGIAVEMQLASEIDDWTQLQTDRLPVFPLRNRLTAGPAQPQPRDGAGVIEAITEGVQLVKQRLASGLVTLPINKKSLYDAGFEHPGHTEYLGSLAQDWPAKDVAAGPVRPVMMLAGPDLRAVPVTIHIPLKDVPGALTTADIVETGVITARDLTRRFGIERPRLAISGLNPHAGEGGALGKEDQAIISPAIEKLTTMGIDCFGPLPADTMFHAAARQTYDAAVCMYHDQALIPAKALAFDETVNVTLGLPFIRTSPDHGTAFDLAGTGKANPASTLAALHLAADMARKEENRAQRLAS